MAKSLREIVPINELSPRVLGSYISKASGSPKSKRVKGVKQAIERLGGDSAPRKSSEPQEPAKKKSDFWKSAGKMALNFLAKNALPHKLNVGQTSPGRGPGLLSTALAAGAAVALTGRSNPRASQNANDRFQRQQLTWKRLHR